MTFTAHVNSSMHIHVMTLKRCSPVCFVIVASVNAVRARHTKSVMLHQAGSRMMCAALQRVVCTRRE